MTLVEAPHGTKVKVTRRESGRGFRSHLDGIGIHVGDELLVLQSAPFGGPVLVEVVRTGVRIALGHGMADRVEVVPLEPEGAQRVRRTGHETG